jgi:hypothetical protein
MDRISDPKRLPELLQAEGQLPKQISLHAARYFHNFSASTGTLVDHTRIHVRSFFSGMTLEEEYNDKVKERFASWGPGVLVKGLRNYTLHRALPFVGSHFEMKPSEDDPRFVDVSHSFTLSVETLLEWKGWREATHKPALALLEELRDQRRPLEVRWLVDAYAERVQELMNWLRDAEMDAVGAAEEAYVAERNALVDEVNSLLPPLNPAEDESQEANPGATPG